MPDGKRAVRYDAALACRQLAEADPKLGDLIAPRRPLHAETQEPALAVRGPARVHHLPATPRQSRRGHSQAPAHRLRRTAPRARNICSRPPTSASAPAVSPALKPKPSATSLPKPSTARSRRSSPSAACPTKQIIERLTEVRGIGSMDRRNAPDLSPWPP